MIQFRDPIHGYIEVSENELKIINSSPFQRLRNIRQLATTYLVYHGAEHTRFGHSLGVMHLVSRVFDTLMKKHTRLFSKDDDENSIKVVWYRQILRIIGLIHDLGHAPFSHASEELFEKGQKHEDFTKFIITETEIEKYICNIGKEFQNKYGHEYNIDPELIWLIYDGSQYTHKNFIAPDFIFLKSLMDGELDCDKMDYLLRDSYYCGVNYGNYDLNRFISTLTIYTGNNTLELAVERGGVQALEEFILARYFMFIQVYFHKTRRYLDKLLVKCLKNILPNGTYPSVIHDYLKWDDVKVLNAIANSDNSDIIQFKNREIMTCIYESKAHSGQVDKNYVNIIFNSLKKELNEDDLLVDSVDKAAHKLTPAIFEIDDDGGRGIKIIDSQNKEVHNLMTESLILDSIVKPISISRIYSRNNIAEKAKEIIKELQYKENIK